jgi:hypothetical protein
MKTGEAAGDVTRKLPACVESTRERFEKWRRERPSRGCRIPTELWAAAARCARQFGYYRTAHVLGLDSGKLKRQAEAPGKGQPRRSVPGFVELLGPGRGTLAECVVEMENGAGVKLRMELRGSAVPDLVELARRFGSKEP